MVLVEQAYAEAWCDRKAPGGSNPAATSWSAAVLRRFREPWAHESARGRAHSRTLARAAEMGRFTTLVSKNEHLPRLEKALRQVQAAEVRLREMAQGQK